MWQSKQYYKSLADYDFNRVLQQKKNLAQVQSVLTLYEKNNQNLVDQVHDLIKQNQLLRKKTNQTSLKQSKFTQFTPFKPKNAISEVIQIQQLDNPTKITEKKQNTMQFVATKMNHPRNVYLAPQQIQLMNKKLFKEVKTLHKTYDLSKEYEQFKEKLSQKKREIKKSYRTKSNIENSQLSLSRNVYIQEPSLEIIQRKPLKQMKKIVNNAQKTQIKKKSKNEPSPYQIFKHQMIYHSPFKKQSQQQVYSARRSTSAIKIQSVYPQNSIRIAQPKTKWGQLSSTYFEKSKYNPNEEFNQGNYYAVNKQCYETSQSKSIQSKRKKFLNVVSQSIQKQKGKQKKIK